jgi:threonine dehydratase
LLKLETLQHTGSFKFRGAWNRLAQLSAAERAVGVVAFSSGNHAQGVAEAARRLGIRATIVMPSDAPALKLRNTRAMGAEVVEYDRVHESREQIAARIADERGATLVPSFDDPEVIAGQGTVGLEIAEQADEQGFALDDVIVCCSGGGLTAGIGIALASLAPQARLWTAEPEGYDDHRRSLESGRRQRNEPGNPTSICDALLAPMPGELTFAINQSRLEGGLAVSDAEVRRAIAFAARTLKLVVEPGGAVALASVLSGKLPVHGRTVAVTLSGANIEDGLLADILQREPA